jgi:hypothetical protein
MISLDKLDSAFHSVEIKNAAGQALALDGSGYITANVNGSVTVTASQLDIDDLDSASDSVEIKTAAGQALSIDGSGYLTVNGNGTFTVSATDLDIRDLTHASDSLKIGDGTDFLAIESDGSINANVTQGGFSSWKVSVESVGTTEGELVSTPLTGRVSMLIQNLSSNDIFIKEATGVAVTDLEIPKGSSFEANLDATANVFAIAASGTNSVKVVEYAA